MASEPEVLHSVEQLDPRVRFMQEVQFEKQLENRLFELTLMQDISLGILMTQTMSDMQRLIWKENVNQIARFMRKAVPLMQQAVADQIEAELKRADYKVALMRLIKYIKDTRAELRSEGYHV